MKILIACIAFCCVWSVNGQGEWSGFRKHRSTPQRDRVAAKRTSNSDRRFIGWRKRLDLFDSFEDMLEVRRVTYEISMSFSFSLSSESSPEPSSTESSPTGSTPTDSTPTGSAPTEPSPTGSAPTGSAPTEPSPTGSAPTGSAPTEPSPTGSAPTGPVPTEASPTGSALTGSAPTEASPTGSAPIGSVPTEASPTGSVPTGGDPTEPSPTASTPTGSAPTESSPTGSVVPGPSNPTEPSIPSLTPSPVSTAAPFDPPITPEPSATPSSFAPPTPGPTVPPTTSGPTAGSPVEDDAGGSATSPSFPIVPANASDCLDTNKLKLGAASDNGTIAVPLDMSYNVESTSDSMDDFSSEVEYELIRTAALAIFGCNPEIGDKIAPNTQEIVNATCDPLTDVENDCFVMQTMFVMWVEGDSVDPDVAAYDAYSAIKGQMEDGSYAESIDPVESIQFVSPLPLIKPSSAGSGGNPSEQVDTSDLQRSVDVSGWTIGFSVASVMGGFVSLLVYARSRKRRRALQEETTPWVNPDNDDAASVL